jgi:DNA polymerase-3 subunit alpha
VSLPDIDIDFDDEGRSSVMDYVIRKYGSKQVATNYGKWPQISDSRYRVYDLPCLKPIK